MARHYNGELASVQREGECGERTEEARGGPVERQVSQCVASESITKFIHQKLIN